ncbi:hypothetical protein FPRO04_14706 [Fusarium proliferatum]|nr:hypothetical protein FPRO03_10238 [Fusarium proliferatum]KAG4271130.1 hypothetical protein FPRO04_14706 [Fusarium proliferatum]
MKQESPQPGVEIGPSVSILQALIRNRHLFIFTLMKVAYTALFTLAATAVNACDSTLCEGATVLRVVPCTKECMGRPCHLYDCPDSLYTYICGKDKTKCDEIW